MCRHLAYLGPPASLRSLLIDPPHGLYRQAWAPRRQRHGTVNADGFGIGWYAAGDPVPARYRRGEPIWGDPSLPDLARVTRSGAVLAAVRSATPGTAAGEEAAAPFGGGPWLFSHNGALAGWRDCGALARAPRPRRTLLVARGADRLGVAVGARAGAAAGGAALDAALAGTIGAVEAAGGTGRLNLLLTDGHVDRGHRLRRHALVPAVGGGVGRGRVRAGRRRARLDRGARPARADRTPSRSASRPLGPAAAPARASHAHDRIDRTGNDVRNEGIVTR